MLLLKTMQGRICSWILKEVIFVTLPFSTTALELKKKFTRQSGKMNCHGILNGSKGDQEAEFSSSARRASAIKRSTGCVILILFSSPSISEIFKPNDSTTVASSVKRSL